VGGIAGIILPQINDFQHSNLSEISPQWLHVAQGLREVQSRMAAAAAAAGRQAAGVTLVAVSKTFPPAAIRAAAACGQRHFGENYVQEARAKQDELAGLDLVWHHIGPIQSNKTRDIAVHFDWVHGIEREKIARRLSEQRPPGMPPLNVCIQVNVSGEASKSGVAPHEVAALAGLVASLPGLKLRGLMAIPEPGGDARPRFRLLRELLDGMNAQGLALDTLSMGMSDDFEIAVAEGATMVRIGSAIFGKRNHDDK